MGEGLERWRKKKSSKKIFCKRKKKIPTKAVKKFK
jgi:hypothetical protein